MNLHLRSYLFGCVIIASVAGSAEAAPPYRCAGKVQFAPCPAAALIAVPPTSIPPIVARAPQTRRRPSLPGAYSRVHSLSFKRVGRADGLWRGVVEGHGNISLSLLIKKAGVVVDRWPIGSITLLRGNSSPFSFRTVPPSGEDWSWEVIANS